MEEIERQRYTEAIKRASISKAFDRILNIVVIIIFLCVAGFVVYQQAVYQEKIAGVTKERNFQLNEIEAATQSLKAYNGCLKGLPVSPGDAAIKNCYETTKSKGEPSWLGE